MPFARLRNKPAFCVCSTLSVSFRHKIDGRCINTTVLLHLKVERAIPPIRNSGGHRGVRTFVGSRSASVDATFSDAAEGRGLHGVGGDGVLEGHDDGV